MEENKKFAVRMIKGHQISKKSQTTGNAGEEKLIEYSMQGMMMVSSIPKLFSIPLMLHHGTEKEVKLPLVLY
jgi:hypothetical protein